MFVKIKDSIGKVSYVAPAFISLIKDSGRGYHTVFDVAGNMTHVSDVKAVEALIKAMENCNEAIFLPSPDQKVSYYLPADFDVESPDDVFEEEDLDEVPEPKKKPARAKKPTKK